MIGSDGRGWWFDSNDADDHSENNDTCRVTHIRLNYRTYVLHLYTLDTPLSAARPIFVCGLFLRLHLGEAYLFVFPFCQLEF